MTEAVPRTEPVPLRDFLTYFLRLGTFGFGGPIALAGAMQRDLVDQRRWISREQYLDGLALAQLAPGPLAAQLAIYLGWVRAGVLGATLVAIAFVLPSFLMVLALSAAYVRFGGVSWLHAAFYGIGASVIAIILRSAYKLTKLTMGRDKLLWAVFIVNAFTTAWTEREIVSLILLSGVATLVWRKRNLAPTAAMMLALPGWMVTGLGPEASPALLWRLTLFFAEAGAFVFGSGLAIVPFLYGGVVETMHWLTERQFLDAVAVAMITPGPVVITVSFIGYLVAGPLGAILAAFAVFLPCYLFVIIPAPYYGRFSGHEGVKAVVAGITAAATGAIAGAAFVLGKRAIFDLPTVAIFLVTLLVLTLNRRIPEPIIVLLAGVAGVLLAQ